MLPLQKLSHILLAEHPRKKRNALFLFQRIVDEELFWENHTKAGKAPASSHIPKYPTIVTIVYPLLIKHGLLENPPFIKIYRWFSH